jgi:hypothetical protein
MEIRGYMCIGCRVKSNHDEKVSCGLHMDFRDAGYMDYNKYVLSRKQAIQ